MPKLSPVAIVTAITVIIGLSQIFIPMMVGFVGFNKNFNAVLEVLKAIMCIRDDFVRRAYLIA